MGTTHSIKGVLKSGSGKPVSDAIVMIKEGSDSFNDIASISDENGEFYVSGIGVPGRYVLQIEHDNGSILKEINVQSANQLLKIII